jgi:hypothetical protein
VNKVFPARIAGHGADLRRSNDGGPVTATRTGPDRARAHTAYGGVPRTERSYTSGPARAMSSAALAANDAAGG